MDGPRNGRPDKKVIWIVDWNDNPDRANWKTNYMSRCKNVFEAILRYGHDEDFVPNRDDNFIPTDAPAGSPDKIEVLRRRVELGQPLWHTTDRVDYSGLTGAIRPRE